MKSLLTALVLFNAGSFLCYGFSCLFSTHMKNEFTRFGLKRQRILTGCLQLAAAAGLVAGLKYPVVAMLAAAGLGLLMLLGLGVRLRIKDPFPACLPALAYMGLSFYISYACWLLISS